MRKYLAIGVVALIVIVTGVLIVRGAAPSATPPPNAASVNVAAETTAIRDTLDAAMRDYRLGDYKTAFKDARSAYLDHFEAIEIPLRALDPDLTLDMEYRFADLRTKMNAGADSAAVETAARSVRDGVDEIDTMFSGNGVIAPMLALTSSFTIIFREGLEASLVIAALLAYLQASQSRALGRYLLYGVGLAGIASLASWAVVHYVISITPVARELLEAIVSVVAVGVLFWVNFWLLRRVDQKRWMEFMRARAWSAMASGSAIGLAVIGFTAVYREGLETALFYEALVFISKQMEIYVGIGFLIGLIALGVLAYGLFRTGKKMQVVSYLKIAVPLLMVMSVAFIGTAVEQLQEAGFIGATSLLGVFPRLPHVVAQLTGIHPTIETLTAQIVLALVYVGGFIWVRTHQSKSKPTPTPSTPTSPVAHTSAA